MDQGNKPLENIISRYSTDEVNSEQLQTIN